MSATPNFGFEVPVGSDVVNLLTQNYPNWTSLDSILQAIKDAGVTTATQTKVGTVHQLVRTVSSCNVLRFTATANYASGDTFTVDGNAVTTTTPQGTSLEAGAFVINQSVIGVLNGSVLTLAIGGGSSNAAGISYDNTGSGLTASNVQDAIDEVVSDIPANAAALSYDNTGSGLTASNVQDAIDEIAQGGGGGSFTEDELWVNPDTTQDVAENTQITITAANLSSYDAFVIEMEPNTSGGGITSNPISSEIDASELPITTEPHFIAGVMTLRSSPNAAYCANRPITAMSITGTTLSITVGRGMYMSGGVTPTTNAGVMIPYKVLGIKYSN